MGKSRTYIIFFLLHLITIMAAQELDKRGPHGFFGMRGKKLSDFPESEQFYKRKPQFFVGVKGKKSYDDLISNEIKRSPLGFYGVRGKKDLEDYMPRHGPLIGQIDYSSMSMDSNPGIDELINDILNKIQLLHKMSREREMAEESADNYDVAKRAANIHQFFGVRGKKSIQDTRTNDITVRDKFIGVRGKKEVNNNEAQELRFLYGQNGPLPKRKGQMGFIGMRGKKWTDESSPEVAMD